MWDKICAVVVTYYPSEKNIDNLRVIIEQFSLVIIVDNTPHSDENYYSRFPKSSKIHVINNCKNKGIAKALNQGIEYARNCSMEWVATFDQDTKVDSDFLEEILTSCFSYLQSDNVGVIGVNYLNENNLQPAWAINKETYITEISDVITSGCLTSVRAFDSVGGFCEKLFIDMVDCEYCFRLRKNGYKVLLYTKPIIRHSLGNLTIITVFSKKIKLFNHQPFRRYFIFRNTIYMLKKYYLFDIRWSFFKITLNYLPKLFIKACLLENRRKENFVWIIRGIRDGLFSRFDNAFMMKDK